MIWIIVFLVLIVVFGLGTVLEAAFWSLLLIAAFVLLLGLLGSAALGR
jgi:hypothetical protein